jgi:hypothetical protein
MNASKLNVGGTPIINGTVGRILFQGASDTLGESANLFWDNTNARLGIGTSSPAQSLDIFSGNIDLRGSSSPKINIGTGGYPKLSLNNRTAIQEEGSTFMSIGRGYSNIGFYLSNTQIAAFASTGNLLINTGTDAGFKLDVNGTGRFKTTDSSTPLNVAHSGAVGIQVEANANGYRLRLASSTTNASIQTPDSYLSINSGGQAVVIGTSTNLGASLGIKGSGATSATTSLLVQNSASTELFRVNNDASSTIGNDNIIGGSLLINGGQGVTSNDVILLNLKATNNLAYGVGTKQWILLGKGGSPVCSGIAGINLGNNQYESGLLFATSTGGSGLQERMRIFANGNIGINTTTDAGYKLDVNGTARVSGNVELPNFSLVLQAGISGYAGGGNVLLGNNSNIRSMNSSNTGTINLIKLNGSGYVEIGGNNNSGTIISPLGETVVIGNSTFVNSSMCTINSTTKGFLPPRMTNAQRTAIASPAVGLIVYCTDATEGLWIYKSSGWTFIV